LYSEKPLVGELAILPPNWSSKVLSWPPKRFWTQIRLSYEMLVSPPDILFIPVHVFPLIHPQKTVMTVHDVAAIRFPKSYNRFERWYTIWSGKFAARKLWKVIVPSKFTESELEFLTEEKNTNVHLVYHGFDAKIGEIKSSEEKNEILRKYNITKPFFVTLGRIEEKKNTGGLLRAFALFRKIVKQDFQLVLIGKPGYGYARVQEEKQGNLFAKDIVELGYVEAEDLSSILQSAHALVFPSLYEGFGIPVLEGFAAGIPVITSQQISTDEIAGDAAILVNPQDIEDIADAMRTVTEDITLQNTLIKKGAERVKDFSWEKCARETLNVLLNK
jgi:glycosyltransferase involved in cell wall biosynthesis